MIPHWANDLASYFIKKIKAQRCDLINHQATSVLSGPILSAFPLVCYKCSYWDKAHPHHRRTGVQPLLPPQRSYLCCHASFIDIHSLSRSLYSEMNPMSVCCEKKCVKYIKSQNKSKFPRACLVWAFCIFKESTFIFWLEHVVQHTHII